MDKKMIGKPNSGTKYWVAMFKDVLRPVHLGALLLDLLGDLRPAVAVDGVLRGDHTRPQPNGYKHDQSEDEGRMVCT
jgi:hypothetical protein